MSYREISICLQSTFLRLLCDSEKKDFNIRKVFFRLLIKKIFCKRFFYRVIQRRQTQLPQKIIKIHFKHCYAIIKKETPSLPNAAKSETQRSKSA